MLQQTQTPQQRDEREVDGVEEAILEDPGEVAHHEHRRVGAQRLVVERHVHLPALLSLDSAGGEQEDRREEEGGAESGDGRHGWGLLRRSPAAAAAAAAVVRRGGEVEWNGGEGTRRRSMASTIPSSKIPARWLTMNREQYGHSVS
uniref:Uncharacterized protein n=1 Tax=Oryza meridionalis TaxID=40149 RepID=A0A0E0CZ69_9ORYZ